MASSITALNVPKAPAPVPTSVALPRDEGAGDLAILEFQSPSLTLIQRPAPFSARMTAWLVSGIVMTIILLAGFIAIDVVVVTAGQVMSVAPNVIVQPFETAIVRKIYVKEGQVVKKGDLLAQLDPTIPGSDATATIAQRASLQAETERLRAEIDRRPYRSDGTQYGQMQELAFLQRQGQFNYTLTSYNEQIKSLQAKVDQAQSDIRQLTQRLAGMQTIEAMRKDLERLAVGSRLNTLTAIDQRLQVEQALEDARNTLQGTQRDLAAKIADRDSWQHQWLADTQQQLTQQERSLSDMAGQAEKNSLRRQLVDMRAEADSIVLSVTRVNAGAVLQSGVELMETVPLSAPLHVVALVDPGNSGYVAVGDKVDIKFQTLPYSRYGYAYGTVTSVGANSLSDPTQGQSSPTSTTPSALTTTAGISSTGLTNVWYRVGISIDKVDLRDPPPSFRVMPGMPVEADIVVGERTIIQYLFEKYVPFLREGFREPN